MAAEGKRGTSLSIVGLVFVLAGFTFLLAGRTGFGVTIVAVGVIVIAVHIAASRKAVSSDDRTGAQPPV
jgi:parvulin-like peptidyl-prolyl isomerase